MFMRCKLRVFYGHQAKKTKARLDSWGEFRCPETGGWTPVPGTTLAESDSYWCSLGVAEFARDTIKLTAAFADTQLPAFDGTKLKDWQDAVRCTLLNSLQRCRIVLNSQTTC